MTGRKAYKTGMNPNVRVRLPTLPARNVNASHFEGRHQHTVPIKRGDERDGTLRGSDRVKMVTRGMYRTATAEPAIHALKYRLWNQSASFVRRLTTKNQKHSSVAPVGVLRC